MLIIQHVTANLIIDPEDPKRRLLFVGDVEPEPDDVFESFVFRVIEAEVQLFAPLPPPVKKTLTLTPSDVFRLAEATKSAAEAEQESFTFVDHDGKEHTMVTQYAIHLLASLLRED